MKGDGETFVKFLGIERAALLSLFLQLFAAVLLLQISESHFENLVVCLFFGSSLTLYFYWRKTTNSNIISHWMRVVLFAGMVFLLP